HVQQAIEWLRALSYRDLLSTGLAREVEEALTRRISALAGPYGDALPLQRMLCTIALGSLKDLAQSTGVSALQAAVVQLLDRSAEIDQPGRLENVRKVLSDGRPTTIVTRQEYRALLTDAYGFEETAEEIETLAGKWLEEEVEILTPLARRVAGHLGLSTADLETVVAELSRKRRRAQGRGVFEEAKRQPRIALPVFHERLVELNPAQRKILPEATPSAMTSIVTEGEEYMVGALSEAPRSHCFITEGECESVYTLA